MSKLDSKKYNKELKNLQIDIKLQEWIKQDQLKVVVLLRKRCSFTGKGESY